MGARRAIIMQSLGKMYARRLQVRKYDVCMFILSRSEAGMRFVRWVYCVFLDNFNDTFSACLRGFMSCKMS